MKKVMMYSRFERIWHWSQGLLVIAMLITGFEIHGTYSLFGFESAVDIHIVASWTLIAIWFLGIFWNLVTGEWKQYIPASSNKLFAMLKYYGVDIFIGGGEHPHHKTRRSKLNPIQRMAYLSLHIFMLPFAVLSGLLYFFYPYWAMVGLGGMSLLFIALVRTAMAFMLIAFLIVHLYMALTTSEEFLGYLKAMIVGYEKE
ncbi:MAG: cytochrome b/b6 domain-containing protein [Gammaproteobacteria bacterium]|nr:cytochrome b/b6 domain-containing protein [Gammaproteobacteria bacterium]